MTTVEPVDDWAEDFELFDPAYVRDPAPTWRQLRENGCPFARTERRQVSYLPVTFDGVRSIAKDSETWSSFSISVVPDLDAEPDPEHRPDNPDRIRSIIDSDPPHHTPERQLMLPFFAPRSVEKYRAHTQELCRRLIRGFIEDGHADIADGYARQIPPRIIAMILGIDPEMADTFTEWVQAFPETRPAAAEPRRFYTEHITDFFAAATGNPLDYPAADPISLPPTPGYPV